MSLIAHDILRATSGGDDEILQMMVAQLEVHLPRELARLRAAVAAANLRDVRDIAHKLYGIVAAFSRVVGECAQQLEDAASGGDSATASARLAQLEVEIPVLMQQLSTLTIAELEARS